MFTAALKCSPVDFGISCGHRNKTDQLVAFQEGWSKLTWPKSKHNREPSWAVDFFPLEDGKAAWTNYKLFYLVAGIVLGIAHDRGYKFRWGGAWDGTINMTGQFTDLPHIEIMGG